MDVNAHADPDPAFRPTDWDSYIGQDALKRRLDVMIDAALQGNRAMPPVLLHGPPGCGKTTLARIIAARLGDPLLCITKPPTSEELFNKLLGWDETTDGWEGVGVCFIDEAQRLSRVVQEDLLTLLEGGYLESSKRGRATFPMLTVIAATTEREQLLRPVIDRFVEPTFEPYTDYDLQRIVEGMASRAGCTISPEDAQALGRAAAGIPRRARHLVTCWRDLEQVRGEPPSLDEVFELTESSPDGLTTRHLAYLNHLGDMHGRAGLSTLAARMRLHESEIRELERLLLDRKLVTLASDGRRLTAAGRARLVEGDAPVRGRVVA